MTRSVVKFSEELILPSLTLIHFERFAQDKLIKFFNKGYIAGTQRVVGWAYLPNDEEASIPIINNEHGDEVGKATLIDVSKQRDLEATFQFYPGMIEAIRDTNPGKPGLFISPLVKSTSSFNDEVRKGTLYVTIHQVVGLVVSTMPLKV